MACAANNLLNVALLHIAPRAGDLAFNRLLIEDAIVTAAAQGSHWVITPELAVCGYTFAPLIGTDWISVQPDPWMARIGNLAARLGIVVFLYYSASTTRHTSAQLKAGKIWASPRRRG